jgi:hypothetical protein
MDSIRITLSALWTATMLTYLLGDVLRIFSGDFKAGDMGGYVASQWAYLGMAALFVLPAAMVYLSLTLADPINRWANITLAGIFFLINVVGLPTYPSAYDKFLIAVSLVFNVLIAWHAWRWL